MVKDSVNVRVEFHGDLANAFEAVKADSGLTVNAEVLRQLVTKKYQEITQMKNIPSEGAP